MKVAAGYGERDITPPLGIDLCGYGFYLDRKGEGVLDTLEARSLLVEGGGDRVLIVSLDLIGLSVAFTDILRKEAAKRLGLGAENVLVACTHTHSGPATADLPGLGGMDPEFMKELPERILESARAAEADLEEARLFHHAEIIEPIGYNRRTKGFAPIDPELKVALFRRKNGEIFLLNHACHGVTLGPSREISADWPGAVVRRIEEDGNHALLLQGFCGDIDPVTQMNRWGRGAEEDLETLGRLVAARAIKAERFAAAAEEGPLLGRERRISLPLAVPKEPDFGARRTAFMASTAGALPNAGRFFDAWEKEARRRHPELLKNPQVEKVPLQALRIGSLRILAVAGEADCGYAGGLRRRPGLLMTAGYAGGVVGYLPARAAFEDPRDYACHQAPMFYGSHFPFENGIEDLLVGQSEELLDEMEETA